MRIEEALSQIRSLYDLPALIEALGGEPRFQEVGPREAFGRAAESGRILAAAEVGRFGTLPCLAVLAERPAHSVEKLVRHGMKRGEPIFAIGVDPGAGVVTLGTGVERAVSISTDVEALDAVALAAL